MDTCKNRLIEAVLTCTHNQCFEHKYQKHQIISNEIFYFVAEKKICILHRGVFIVCFPALNQGNIIYHSKHFS